LQANCLILEDLPPSLGIVPHILVSTTYHPLYSTAPLIVLNVTVYTRWQLILAKLLGPIPKLIADKLVKLETTSEDVLTRLKRLEQQADLIKLLKTRSETLEDTVQKLTKQNRILAIAVQDQEQTIDKLFSHLGKNKSHAPEDSDEDSPPKGVKHEITALT
jgi:hypothetical protein